MTEVEMFQCAGQQTAPCRHRLERGDTLVLVLVDGDSVAMICEPCWQALVA